MYFMQDVANELWNVIRSISIVDIIDMLLLAYLIYKLIVIIRETRAGQLLKGIAFIVVAYFLCKIFKLKALAFILDNTINVGLIAILIMFQPELRRMLEKFGRTSIPQLNQFFTAESTDVMNSKWSIAIDEICEACEELSATTTGALIVIERQTKLGEQIDTGTIMNASPTKELFGNIFYPKTPLHDGAVIMRDGIILAAACFLPKPQKEEFINKKLGSRHRAAIGMSENSDAIIVVVSEETGTISIAENGRLERPFDKDSLRAYLSKRLITEKNPPSDSKKNIKYFRKSKGE